MAYMLAVPGRVTAAGVPLPASLSSGPPRPLSAVCTRQPSSSSRSLVARLRLQSQLIESGRVHGGSRCNASCIRPMTRKRRARRKTSSYVMRGVKEACPIAKNVRIIHA